MERTSEESRVWSVSTKSLLVTSLSFAIGDLHMPLACDMYWGLGAGTGPAREYDNCS